MDEHKEDIQDKELRQRYENAMDSADYGPAGNGALHVSAV